MLFRVTLEIEGVFDGEDARDAVDFAEKTLIAASCWDGAHPVKAKAVRLTLKNARKDELRETPWAAYTGPERSVSEWLGGPKPKGKRAQGQVKSDPRMRWG
jgi:hypothetical protein